jgi:hypothetical protein
MGGVILSDFKEEILSKLEISLNDIIIVYPDNIKSKEDGFGIYAYDVFSSDIISKYKNILKSFRYCLQTLNPQLLWFKPGNC